MLPVQLNVLTPRCAVASSCLTPARDCALGMLWAEKASEAGLEYGYRSQQVLEITCSAFRSFSCK